MLDIILAIWAVLASGAFMFERDAHVNTRSDLQEARQLWDDLRVEYFKLKARFDKKKIPTA